MAPSISLFDLTPGKTIEGRFEILRSFRQGTMSATFEVKEGDAVRELQVFPAGLFESAQQGTEFGAELRRWQKVQCDSVLRVHEVISKEDGSLLMLTDFPPGESLRAQLKQNGPLSAEDTVRLGLRILDGLVEAHVHDLVHGDIKPYTLHMQAGDPSSAVLVDGGITTGLWSAKHLGEKTALIGTPIYAPAEQFGGESPNVQSDIYNLATVLFEAVCGTVPWPGKTFLEVFQAKLDKTAPSMRRAAPEVEVDPALEKAIVGGLMTDSRERYGSAEEFRDALRKLGT